MAKCKTCKRTNWCKDEKGRRYNWCPVIDDCPDPEADGDCDKHETMTNADRIQSMSYEELAEYLVNFKNTFGEEYEGEISCLEWLQSEVEEEQ